MAHPGYRPDIDGLRALAVLAVIVVHAFPTVLPGGFCGVDVFFVISGYLITRILNTDRVERRFDLRLFYARRIRRLFPALLVMLFLCMAVGYVFLLPTEYESLGRHVAAGTVFGQNVLLWRESGYFAVDSFRVPLQHLWSLAVEEQFYVVFPLLLAAAWRWRWPVTRVLAGLLVASFVANVVAARYDESADFYLMPYRAWEFLAGALLACREAGGKPWGSQSRRDWASLVGGALLALSFVFAKPAGFPGWQATVPVLGTTLLLAAGHHGWSNRILLAHPIAVWIGLVSYPLYLFHWPLLCLIRICRNGTPSALLVAAAVVASFGLAAITFIAIERPLRPHRSRWTVPALVIGFVLVGMAGQGISTQRLPPRNASPELDDVVVAMRDTLHQFIHSHRDDFRRQGDVGATGGTGPQTLFFGDSFASQYVPRVMRLVGGNRGDTRGALVLVGGAIPPIPGVTSLGNHGCPELMQTFRELIATDPRIDRVVIAACWPYYFESNRDYLAHGLPLVTAAGAERAATEFGGLLADLTAAGKSVTLVLPAPWGKELAPAGMLSRSLRGRITKKFRPLTVPNLQARFPDHARAFLAMIEATARQHGVRVVDPLEQLAVDGVCITEDADGPIRYDTSHLRPGFVAEHITYLDDTLSP
jgi:peptidoglycan/LPS O-acetylase OafA/YrhL